MHKDMSLYIKIHKNKQKSIVFFNSVKCKYKNPRTIEYLKFKETHKNHQVQLLELSELPELSKPKSYH